MTTNSSVNYDTIVPVHQEGTFTFPDLNQQHYRQGSVMNLTWESNLTNVDLAVTQHTKKTPFYFEYIGPRNMQASFFEWTVNLPNAQNADPFPVPLHFRLMDASLPLDQQQQGGAISHGFYVDPAAKLSPVSSASMSSASTAPTASASSPDPMGGYMPVENFHDKNYTIGVIFACIIVAAFITLICFLFIRQYRKHYLAKKAAQKHAEEQAFTPWEHAELVAMTTPGQTYPPSSTAAQAGSAPAFDGVPERLCTPPPPYVPQSSKGKK